jgi:hypothetical protein
MCILGSQVANWLDAVLYKTTFRPIELKQWVKVERDLRDAQDQVSLVGSRQAG